MRTFLKGLSQPGNLGDKPSSSKSLAALPAAATGSRHARRRTERRRRATPRREELELVIVAMSVG
jgi:hypothetical protein